MYKKLEALGSKMLGRFVPRVDASASAATPCSYRSFSSCYQCNYGPCRAYCCDGAGCQSLVICG
jgi:hypothetical protein